MSKKVRLGTFYPKDLDLNGDQANLLVLAARLKWRGVSSEIVSVTGDSDFSNLDLLFIGHGALAAWVSLLDSDRKFISSAVEFMQTGKPLIAVSSGYIKVLEHLSEPIQTGEHRSEFVDVEGVVGYLNSSADVPLLQRRGSSLLTMLHGPILAKNPDLCDQIISGNGWADVSLKNKQLDEVDSLAKASRKTAFEN